MYCTYSIIQKRENAYLDSCTYIEYTFYLLPYNQTCGTVLLDRGEMRRKAIGRLDARFRNMISISFGFEQNNHVMTRRFNFEIISIISLSYSHMNIY